MALALAHPRPLASTSLLAQIGNTSLIELVKVPGALPGVEVCAKAEFFNPGGPVKDRPARVVVTVLCDGAGKHLSEEFWNDPD